MSKFKVGDKVEYVAQTGNVSNANKGEVISIFRRDVKVDFEGLGICHVSECNLKHLTPFPIRTVTATEIVAGTYGKVGVDMLIKGKPFINVAPLTKSQDIRESGTLLIKLADALDSGAKVVAK